MATTAAEARARRERAKREGLCCSCLKRIEAGSGTRCPTCKEKARECSTRHYEKNRDRCIQSVARRRREMKERGTLRAYTRKIYLKARFGIAPECYDSMSIEQNGKCAICSEEPHCGRHGILVIDHDHATGEIRGLLCDNCNRGLGFFGDDADRLLAASKYVERWRRKVG